MMNIRPALALAASLLLLPGLCMAQVTATPRTPGWEFGIDTIYQFSHEVTFEGGSNADLESHLGLGFNFGYRFSPLLEVQFALDWSSFSYHGVLQPAPSQPQPQPLSSATNVHGDMETFVPRVNLRYNFLPSSLTPYVDAGIGWAFIDTNIPSGQVTAGCWWDPWWGYVCAPYQATRNTDAFSYQIGTGVRWDFGDSGTLRFGYEKSWLDFSNAKDRPSLDQLKLGIAYRY